ncbi:hypothetical protein SBRY_60334 [Actinacidiphila bryophytorum]|uniref:Uncharacterized protein n=1 Tax=Actinacidiphila bryophytorum TaxID=1436133 RepID=A0A9W4MEX6_9ACTN|nr:hypothetical protein SBRY_60334 [Actinacidiphila bryophytorum]
MLWKSRLPRDAWHARSLRCRSRPSRPTTRTTLRLAIARTRRRGARPVGGRPYFQNTAWRPLPPARLSPGGELPAGGCHVPWRCFLSVRWGLGAQFPAPLKTLTLREGGTPQGCGELRDQPPPTARCKLTASGRA